MKRLILAIRVFFRVLFSAETAERVEPILNDEPATLPAAGDKTQTKTPAKPRAPAQSEAVTLLAALQREARLVDFLQEGLGEYSDAQIGAAVRDVHRDSANVLERMFALKQISDDEEGTEIELAAGFDASRYRLTGKVEGEPPFRGRLAHHGWEATKCELPSWSGDDTAARVVAPVEVELG